MRSLVAGGLMLLAVSCSPAPLSIFTEYVSVETLPSYIIGTPDPRLYCPDSGEKIHITWETPEGYTQETLEIRLSLRFGNGEDQVLTFDLQNRKGTGVFSLLNEEYWEKKGVFTYKVELISDGTVFSTWLHQLWAERIILN